MFSVIRSLIGGSKHRSRNFGHAEKRRRQQQFHWRVAQLEPRRMLVVDVAEVGFEPISVTVGDFNGDGHLDVATANRSGDDQTLMRGSSDVSVLLGKGDGTFRPEMRLQLGDGAMGATHVSTGQFNDDNFLDLVVANEDSDNVSVLLGNGDGTFDKPAHFVVGVEPRWVTSGDFDNDRDLDLAVANINSNDDNKPGTVSVLLNNGSGRFTTGQQIKVGEAPRSVTAGHFDGDEQLDLAVSNFSPGQSGTVSVLLGNGDGTFVEQFGVNDERPSVGRGPRELAAGDFNEDGHLDLFNVNRSSDDASLLLGNGDGTFLEVKRISLSAHGLTGLDKDFPDEENRDQPLSVTAGQFNDDNEDGKIDEMDYLDLATANRDGDNVSVLLGKVDGSFNTAVSFMVGLQPNAVTTGHFNEDRYLDLAAANAGESNVSVLLGNGNGGFAEKPGEDREPIRPMVGKTPRSITTDDFNDDGKFDLAVANADEDSVSVLLGIGDGTFRTQLKFGVGNTPRAVIAGDFDRDSRLDLAVANVDSDDVWVLLGNGDGTFNVSEDRIVPAGLNPFSLTTGDFNGDGITDLAAASTRSHDVLVLFGTGSGGFTSGPVPIQSSAVAAFSVETLTTQRDAAEVNPRFVVDALDFVTQQRNSSFGSAASSVGGGADLVASESLSSVIVTIPELPELVPPDESTDADGGELVLAAFLSPQAPVEGEPEAAEELEPPPDRKDSPMTVSRSAGDPELRHTSWGLIAGIVGTAAAMLVLLLGVTRRRRKTRMLGSAAEHGTSESATVEEKQNV